MRSGISSGGSNGGVTQGAPPTQGGLPTQGATQLPPSQGFARGKVPPPAHKVNTWIRLYRWLTAW